MRASEYQSLTASNQTVAEGQFWFRIRTGKGSSSDRSAEWPQRFFSARSFQQGDGPFCAVFLTGRAWDVVPSFPCVFAMQASLTVWPRANRGQGKEEVFHAEGP